MSPTYKERQRVRRVGRNEIDIKHYQSLAEDITFSIRFFFIAIHLSRNIISTFKRKSPSNLLNFVTGLCFFVNKMIVEQLRALCYVCPYKKCSKKCYEYFSSGILQMLGFGFVAKFRYLWFLY